MTIEEFKTKEPVLFENIKAVLKHVKRYKQFPKDWGIHCQYPEEGKGFKLGGSKSFVRIRYNRFNPNAYRISSGEISVTRFGCVPRLIEKEIPFVLSVWDVDIKLSGERYIFKTADFVK